MSLCAGCTRNEGSRCAVGARPFREHAAGRLVADCSSYQDRGGFRTVAETAAETAPPAPKRGP